MKKKIVLKDSSEVWEIGVPSHEVIQKEHFVT